MASDRYIADRFLPDKARDDADDPGLDLYPNPVPNLHHKPDPNRNLTLTLYLTIVLP